MDQNGFLVRSKNTNISPVQPRNAPKRLANIVHAHLIYGDVLNLELEL